MAKNIISVSLKLYTKRAQDLSQVLDAIHDLMESNLEDVLPDLDETDHVWDVTVSDETCD